MIAEYTPGEDLPTWSRILGYGDPSTGKSRWGTSLTERFGKFLYWGQDGGAEKLESILPEYRDRIAKVYKAGVPDPKGNRPADPGTEAWELVNKIVPGYLRDNPGPHTLIFDTASSLAERVLYHTADTGQGAQSGHVTVAGMRMPNQSDYGAAQGISNRLRMRMFELPCHLIVLCHATFSEPKEGGAPEFGPEIVGKALVRIYARDFDARVHLEQNKGTFVAHLKRHGYWTAGLRSSELKSPIDKITLEDDPINFWKEYDEKIYNKTARPAHV